MNKEYFYSKFLEIQKSYAKNNYDEGNAIFEDFKKEFLTISNDQDLLEIFNSLLTQITEPQLLNTLSFCLFGIIYEKYGYEKTLDIILDPNCPYVINRKVTEAATGKITQEEFEKYFANRKITKAQASLLLKANGKRFVDSFKNIEIPNGFMDGFVFGHLELKEIEAMVNNKEFFTKKFFAYNINQYLLHNKNNPQDAYRELLHLFPNINTMIEPGVFHFTIEPTSNIENNPLLSMIDSESFIKSTTEAGKDKSLALYNSSRFNSLDKGLRNNIINLLISYKIISPEQAKKSILSFDDNSFCMSPEVCNKLPSEYYELFLSEELLNKIDIMSKMKLLNGSNGMSSIEEQEFRKQLIFNTNIIQEYIPNISIKLSNITNVLTFEELKNLINLMQTKQSFSIKYINPNYTHEEIIEILTKPELFYSISFDSLMELLLKLNKEERKPILNNSLFIVEYIKYVDESIMSHISYEEIKDNDLIIDLINPSILSTMINEYLDRTKDLSIIKDEKLLKKIFGENTSKILSLVNMDDVIELAQKSMELSGSNDIKISDLYSFISLVASLGKDTEEILSYGNIKINVRDIINFKNKMLFYSMNSYRRENAQVLDNIYPNVLNALDEVSIENLETRMGLPRVITMIGEDNSSNLFYDTLIKLKNGENKESELFDLCEAYKKRFLTQLEAKESQRLLEVLTKNFTVTHQGKKVLVDRINKERLIEEKKQVVLTRMQNNTISSAFIEEINNLLTKNSLGDYETFSILMMDPIITNRNFDKATFLSFFGYEPPKGYEYYLLNKRKTKVVDSSYSSVIRATKGLDKIVVDKALRYVSGELDSFDEKVNPNIISLLQRERYALEKIQTTVTSDGKIICSINNEEFDDNECIEYQKKEFVVDKLNKMIFKYINSVDVKLSPITEEEQDKLIKSRVSELPLSEEYFEIKHSYYSPTEVGELFSGFDFPYFLENSGDQKELVSFLQRNAKNIKILSSSLDDSYIPGIGVALSNYNRIKKICKWFDIDIDHLDVVDFKRIYDNIAVNLSSYYIDVDRNIIRNICLNDQFSVYKTPNERVERAGNLMEMAIKTQTRTIPFINSKYYETLDPHDPEVLVSGIKTGACFRIGGNAHNMLHYCTLDKNGTIVYIKDSRGKNVARVFGVRRGNGLFLHQLQKFTDSKEIPSKEVTGFLKKYAYDIIEKTKKTEEPIEFVSITDCADVELDETDPLLNDDKCSYVTFPIDETKKDFVEFMKTPGLKEDHIKPIYTNYGDVSTRVIASTLPLEQLTIKDYEATSSYIRKRNKYITYDLGDVEENKEARKKLEKMLYLYSKNSILIEIDINDLSTITIGEDYIFGIDKEGKEVVVNLNYDERSKEEVEVVRSIYDRGNSQVL